MNSHLHDAVFAVQVRWELPLHDIGFGALSAGIIKRSVQDVPFGVAWMLHPAETVYSFYTCLESSL